MLSSGYLYSHILYFHKLSLPKIAMLLFPSLLFLNHLQEFLPYFLYFYWYFSELLRLKCCNIFSLAPIISPCPICSFFKSSFASPFPFIHLPQLSSNHNSCSPGWVKVPSLLFYQLDYLLRYNKPFLYFLYHSENTINVLINLCCEDI